MINHVENRGVWSKFKVTANYILTYGVPQKPYKKNRQGFPRLLIVRVVGGRLDRAYFSIAIKDFTAAKSSFKNFHDLIERIEFSVKLYHIGY